MTFRLVSTMSLVLLLCLGAFAVLMQRHHDMVMDEVARTVADVGKLTLRTFEAETDPAGGHPGRIWVKQVVTVDERREHGGPGEEKRVVVIASSREGAPAAEAKALLDLERIHVDRDPHGLLMKIPVTSAEAGAGFVFKVDREVGGTTKLPAGPFAWEGGGEGIVLPVPTGEYQDLLAATGRRTMLLFLAVFVVGAVVTASVGERLTRPLRRLDTAIRSLSAGNLDVRVDAGRKDELGRVGAAFNDMTARLRASKERERELQRQEKLSSLGRLAAGVAHDVRNPLHAIGLTLQHLQETARPEDAGRARELDRSVAIIREEIHRLDRLVGNFLRFAKSDRAPRAPVDLAALVRETAQLVEREASRRSVEVTVVAAEGLAPVMGDAEALRSSVLNLVLNSLEAMDGGGKLALEARAEPAGIVLEVADTGHGIPAGEQDKVFEFAYTTRDEGHGLGLAMVHQTIVEDHGGRVTLESEPGKGTRVRLHLPVAAGAPA